MIASTKRVANRWILFCFVQICLFFIFVVLLRAVVVYSASVVWHPVLMAAAYLLFLSEGVIAIGWFRRGKYDSRQWIRESHLGCVFAAFLCAFASFCVVLFSNGLQYKFPLVHSLLGVVSLVLLTVEVGVGIKLFIVAKNERRVFDLRLLKKVQRGHRWLGVAAYLVGLATFASGLCRRSSFDLLGTWQSLGGATAVCAFGALVLLTSGLVSSESAPRKIISVDGEVMDCES